MHKFFTLSALIAACCTTMVGCGGSGLGTVPVSGKVLVDGQPMEGVVVVFNPDDPEGRAASGTTDANGEYKLTTETNGDGALPGSYKIQVTKYEGGQPDVPDTTGMTEEEAMDAMYAARDKAGDEPPAKNLIADRFGNSAGSGLNYQVTESGPNEVPPLEVSAK